MVIFYLFAQKCPMDGF